MRLPLPASCSLVFLGLIGCAVTEAPDGAKAETYYVTGSNIARRAGQPTGSPTYGVSGDEIRKGQTRMPDLIPPPEQYRGTGN